MKRLFFLVSLSSLLLLAANPGGIAASSASQSVAPMAIVTLKGATGGQPVANLAVQDQSGADDDPSKYVTFTTPLTIYKGYRRFLLPAGVIRSRVTGLSVKANYNGPASASQAWSWFLYNWSLKTWVKVGTNGAASPNVWTLLTFNPTSPLRFISAAGEMRLLVQSNNAGADAKLDFENINLTYTIPPTPTPTRTATVTKTPSPSATRTPTRTATPTGMASTSASPVYSDALLNGWGDWSWDLPNHNLAGTSPVHGGSQAIAVTYTVAWSGLQFGLNTPLNVSAYDRLRFWIHGGSAGGQTVQAQISDGSTTLTKNVTPMANAWTQVDVLLNGLGQVTLLAWFNNTAGAQPTFYVDDVAFVSSTVVTATVPPPASGPVLSVNVGADRHAVSPYIYGLNFAAEALAGELNLPVNRWGGNSTSRYNWQLGATNAGSDWYYENKSDGTHAGWIAQNLRTGTDSLLSIPLIGYVAKNGSTATCGFKISKYGSQQGSDSQWQPDCGNGVRSSGSLITGNDPLDTSIAVNESFMKSWVQNLVSGYGSASNGGVRFYDLDNEPELWSETHRDIHPTPESYDELFARSVAYGAAIKQADPGAQLLGYVAFGWSGYWYSMRDLVAGAANGYSYFPDYESHGRLYQVEWYLSQMRQYEQANGTRLLDYLDLHYYPESGVALTNAGDANRQALRLRSTRSLWDPAYIDESWIGAPDQGADMRSVHLLARMRAWVNTYYPGTKLAISEYNFGGLESINGALAQADVLGIFGREGLDLATLWDPPSASQPGAYAFRMYRNYDGAGSAFGDVSVRAASTNQGQLAIYAAQRSSDSALTLMIINKTGGALNANVSLAGFTPAGNGRVYRYSPANLNAIVHLADQAVAAGGFTAGFPANSITLVVIPGSAP
jgi:hypothetical protein